MIRIYRIKNNINGKIYIGQTKNINKRISEHKNNKKYKSKLTNALKKYGLEAFTLTFLAEVFDKEIANKTEEYFINYYNSTLKGYNISRLSGGGVLKDYTEEEMTSINSKKSQSLIKINNKKNWLTKYLYNNKDICYSNLSKFYPDIRIFINYIQEIFKEKGSLVKTLIKKIILRDLITINCKHKDISHKKRVALGKISGKVSWNNLTHLEKEKKIKKMNDSWLAKNINYKEEMANRAKEITPNKIKENPLYREDLSKRTKNMWRQKRVELVRNMKSDKRRKLEYIIKSGLFMYGKENFTIKDVMIMYNVKYDLAKSLLDDNFKKVKPKALNKPTFYSNSNKSVNIEFEPIDSITFLGEEETYDLEVDEDHSYVANGIVIHNSKPNIANMPKQGEFAKEFRRVFACPPDWYYGGFDYSGFQLRIACISSKDPKMLDVFVNHGGDMHSMTAQNIFARDLSFEEFLKVKGKQPYKKYRFEAKKINFANLFGGHFSLSYDDVKKWGMDEINKYITENVEEDLRITKATAGYSDPDDLMILTVCEDLQKKFFKTYKNLEVWHARNKNLAWNYGYIDSDVGGRRHLPRMMYKGEDYDHKKWKNMENITSNSPTQNFEGMIVYEAMYNIQQQLNKYNMKTKIIGMVHDEITHYIYKPEIKNVFEICSQYMNIPTEVYGCPITSELGVGYIWGFDTEMTEKNVDKFEKGNFFKVKYLTSEGEENSVENIAYDSDDITQELLKKEPEAKIIEVIKTH